MILCDSIYITFPFIWNCLGNVQVILNDFGSHHFSDHISIFFCFICSSFHPDFLWLVVCLFFLCSFFFRTYLCDGFVFLSFGNVMRISNAWMRHEWNIPQLLKRWNDLTIKWERVRRRETITQRLQKWVKAHRYIRSKRKYTHRTHRHKTHMLCIQICITFTFCQRSGKMWNCIRIWFFLFEKKKKKKKIKREKLDFVQGQCMNRSKSKCKIKT